MSSEVRVFFAGVGTTFVILAVGFGGGLMMAKSALKEPAGYQARANTESITPVRVILPTSAEAAQPPEPGAAAVATPEPQPQAQPVKEVQAPVEKQVEKADPRRAEAEERERRRRYAERKAKKIGAARTRQQQEQPTRERSEPGIMAFGGDEPRFGGGFFGN